MVSKIWMAAIALGTSLLVASCAADDHVEATVETCVNQVNAQYQGGGSPVGSSGTGQGGQGGTGGANAAPECTADTVEKDCAHLSVPNSQCGNVQCIENKCVLQIKPGPLESQKYGDCKQMVCDALGNLIEMGDDTDFYNDGNECTIDFCMDGAKHFELPDGNQCPEAGEGYCYQGKCTECIQILPQAVCKGPGMVCQDFWCVPFGACIGTCGGNCQPCPFGSACTQNDDCLNLSCLNGLCAGPTCADGVKNDGETGVDCGSQNCPACPAGEGCKTPVNCLSKVCIAGSCQAPSCTDGTENGDEAGIDCGGSCPAPCVGQ